MLVLTREQLIDRLARLMAQQAGFTVIELGHLKNTSPGRTPIGAWVARRSLRHDWENNTEFLEQAQQFYERWEFLMDARDSKEGSDDT